MNDKIQILGRCSICGGNVTVPFMWHGIYPPVPTCNSCGAVKKNTTPVIDMTPTKEPSRDK